MRLHRLFALGGNKFVTLFQPVTLAALLQYLGSCGGNLNTVLFTSAV